MLKRFINLISKPVFLTFLSVLVLLLIIIPDFVRAPVGIYAFKQHANGFPLIDTVINYSPREAYRLIEGYGQSGRGYYVIQSLSLDIVIPLSLMLFVVSLINLIFRHTRYERYMHKLMIIPLIGFLSDYAENVCNLILMVKYPQRLYLLACISNILTMSKGFFCTSGILVVLFGLIIIGIKRISDRRTKRDIKAKRSEKNGSIQRY